MAKAAGCTNSDTSIAFCLLEVASLSENYEKFVLTVVYLEKGNVMDQIKVSLKKFQGRALVSSDKEEIKLDGAHMSKIKDTLMAQRWQRPKKQGRWLNSRQEKKRG